VRQVCSPVTCHLALGGPACAQDNRRDTRQR
jgi:hypothetical protein